ncbi:dihydroneopterin aldolase [Oceanispirochaeta crateris]|uniref:dihydroneopterin aldolase n=2 Tax=Oceanispirochaeta crateris TaxID=2518645 RepID=A0A5C1QRN6_9SPIO|nr:dihydroneopterin aldolase [Oceanispirochaeta crateris]
MTMDKIIISDLMLRCIIGINPDERINKQDVLINLTLYTDFSKSIESEDIEDTVNYKKLKLDIMTLVEGSSFLLVEKLASTISDCCLGYKGVKAVLVKVEKPTALRFARSVGVEIFRKG